MRHAASVENAGTKETVAESEVAAVRPGIEWAEALVTAVQFLTRVPLSSRAPTAAALRRAPLFFPLVGLAIGCFTASVFWLVGLAWPVWVAVLVALAVELRLTGALHEDGLADFCDAFGGGWDREQVLGILKDSRIGTYGTAGLVCGMLLRIAALGSIVIDRGDDGWLDAASALVASAAAGRWMIVLVMAAIPPVAERESLSRDVGSQVSWRGFAVSGLGALPAIAWFTYLMPAASLIAVGLNAVALLMLGSLIRRKLGGVTGDCLGCIGYVSQVLWLVAATARVP
ncbi:adenosylcobinamide-GDP ribazoletransferase [Candidatus Laterigemmans baculatus]|uniref:adenosylcobinamide-GDP ribazoletransferase n=1 Tax=Candidatus Laterigemmans baculatus TaxID=2770505 RepID=UPI0013DA518F|nr:adenosylcobinamide-GDP ribazoletransferase [Candidatus Laterigemmans baculatus]